jgi:hypothetical protein
LFFKKIAVILFSHARSSLCLLCGFMFYTVCGTAWCLYCLLLQKLGCKFCHVCHSYGFLLYWFYICDIFPMCKSCVSFIVSFPWYVKVAHFSFNCCIFAFSFCFCGFSCVVFSVLLSYLLFLNMLCIMAISFFFFFFACFVIY